MTHVAPKLLTAVLCTARKNPQWQWMADSFTRALANCPLPVELIVVDKLLWVVPDRGSQRMGECHVLDRRQALADAVNGRFPYLHTPPKPSPWQGPWKKTPRDHFALCNARNTALALARGDYVCFFDDCIVLDEKYLFCHALSAVRGVATAGSFKGWNKAQVEKGKVIEGELHPMGNDSRGEAVLLAPGGWLYGLNSGFPLNYGLWVNGYDERYDGQGGSEDCDFGVRIHRAGCKIVYNPKCLVHQVLETHEPVCEYETWGKPQPRKQKERVLEADGIPHFANEFLIQELLKDPNLKRAPNERDLGILRSVALEDGFGYTAFPREFAVEEDWRDGAKLIECL